MSNDANASVTQLSTLVSEMSGPDSRLILGITGAPGAGKSTVAAKLAELLGPTALHIGMDGFHLSNELLVELGRRDRKGAWDTFDDAGFANLMYRARNQRPDEIIYAPTFNRDLEQSIGSSLPIRNEHRILIVEGNYLLLDKGAFPIAHDYLDACWYLKPNEDLRHRRLIARHEAYGKSPSEARHWALVSDERNASMIAETSSDADLVVTVREDD